MADHRVRPFEVAIVIVVVFVVILVCTTTSYSLAELTEQKPPAPQATNHKIKFYGLINGYGHFNQTIASNHLVTILEQVTGHPIGLDHFDDTSASWHSLKIASRLGSGFCPEDEIRDLYKTIKAGNRYTRKFKMGLTEEFVPPTSVKLDWLADCENVGRKRSQQQQQTGELDDSPDVENEEPSEEPSSSLAPQTSAPRGLVSLDASAELPVAANNATEASTGVLMTVTSEPAAPMTTSEAPVTQPAPVAELTTTAAIEPLDGKPDVKSADLRSSADSLGEEDSQLAAEKPGLRVETNFSLFEDSFPKFGEPMKFEDFPSGANSSKFDIDIDNNNTLGSDSNFTNALAATTSNTTALFSSPEANLTTESPLQQDIGSMFNMTTSDVPFFSLNESSSFPDVKSNLSLEFDSEKKLTLDSTTTEAIATITTTVETIAGSNEGLEGKKGDDAEAKLGKAETRSYYGPAVGIGLSFIIFLAYLVCLRAYKHQAMYELHKE